MWLDGMHRAKYTCCVSGTRASVVPHATTQTSTDRNISVHHVLQFELIVGCTTSRNHLLLPKVLRHPHSVMWSYRVCLFIKWVLFSNKFVFISDVSFSYTLLFLLWMQIFIYSRCFSVYRLCCPCFMFIVALRRCTIYSLNSTFLRCLHEIGMFAYYVNVYVGVCYVLKNSETLVFIWKA